MAVGMKVCKVCGKSYPACRASAVGNEYRWQDVACCSEHGSEYLARVLASRGEAPFDTENCNAGTADASAPVTGNEDKADASAPATGRDRKKKA